MLDNPKVQRLHQNYCKYTGYEVEPKYFETLLMYFPALAVAASDGHVDEEEWYYIDNLAVFMTRTYRETINDDDDFDKISGMFFQQMKLIISSIDVWEPVFLDCLSEIIADEEEFKETIYEILEMFAESSDGISEVEQQKLDMISEKLQIPRISPEE